MKKEEIMDMGNGMYGLSIRGVSNPSQPHIPRSKRRELEREQKRKQKKQQKALRELAGSIPMICPDCGSRRITQVEECTFKCEDCGAVHPIEDMSGDISGLLL